MSESLYSYDADTELLRLYNRSVHDNDIGFTTMKLNLLEAHALARYCERLFNDAYDRGARDVAAKVSNVLPQDPAI